MIDFAEALREWNAAARDDLKHAMCTNPFDGSPHYGGMSSCADDAARVLILHILEAKRFEEILDKNNNEAGERLMKRGCKQNLSKQDVVPFISAQAVAMEIAAVSSLY